LKELREAAAQVSTLDVGPRIGEMLAQRDCRAGQTLQNPP
jgi:hypothetical protein